MKITKVETSAHWVDWCNWLFVRIETDDGLIGWGEASLHGPIRAVESTIHDLSVLLVGEDPGGPERHWHRLYNAWRWRGGAAFQSAMSGIDIALWDLEGKRLGVPVHRLLGGAHRDRVRVYASHWLSGASAPQAVFDGAKEAVRRGFSGFKWSPFTFERLRENEASALSLAADMMAAARDGAGPTTEIYIECAELLSPRTARQAAALFEPYRPGWMEEPIPYENPQAMADLQRDIAVPIATGERLLSRHEVRALLETGAPRILQPDVMHAGGLTEVKRIAALADTYYVPIAPHNPGGPICHAASLHLAAALPNFLVLEQMEPDRPIRDAASRPPLTLEDGCLVVSDAPGLGLEPCLGALTDHGYRAQPVNRRSGSLYR
ncbi:MAG: mandelate racemase/muconate lactonizing enzyme family protein [Inquilinaceae bacterium]